MTRTHAFLPMPDGHRSAELITMFEDAVMEVRHLSPGARYTLGEGDADLPYADLGGAVDVVRHRVGGGIEIVDAIGLDVAVAGDRVQPLTWNRELATDGVSERRVAFLPSGSRARIGLGSITILVEEASAPQRHPLAPRLDLSAHLSTAVAAAVCFLAVLFMGAIPPGSSSLEIDPFLLEGRNARFTFAAPVVPPAGGAAGSAAASEGGNPKAEALAGMGRPRIVRVAAMHPAGGGAPSRPAATQPDAQATAQRAARTAGILGVLSGAEGSQTGSVFGPGSALGTTAATMATLTGDPIGDTHDAGGLGGVGLVDGGRGGRGGGPGEGTIGSGGIGRIGSCGGPDCSRAGYGYSQGIGSLRSRRATSPEPTPGTATVTEGIDREIIRRVVRRHAPELKFCYERELQRDASLDGRIVTRFVLQTDGRVTTAITESSTMHDAKVETCIAETFKRMQFPKMPPGAGVGIVSYPFTFHKAGG